MSSCFVAVLWAWITAHVKGGTTTAVVSIGIINTVANSAGLIAPIMTSAISDFTGSYVWVAVMAGVFSFLGWGGVFLMNFVLTKTERGI